MLSAFDTAASSIRHSSTLPDPIRYDPPRAREPEIEPEPTPEERAAACLEVGLLQAVRRGDDAETGRLLSLGVNVDCGDHHNLTSLHMAARDGNSDVVALLLGAKASTEERDTTADWTPLFYAASEGHAEVTRMLLAAQADPDATDNVRDPPVHEALRYGHEVCASLLLDAGARVLRRNHARQCALDIASGCAACASLLPKLRSLGETEAAADEAAARDAAPRQAAEELVSAAVAAVLAACPPEAPRPPSKPRSGRFNFGAAFGAPPGEAPAPPQDEAKAQSAGQLAPGEEVVLHGLRGEPALNGCSAVVLGPPRPKSGRYPVTVRLDPLPNKRELLVKPDNLTPLHGRVAGETYRDFERV